jgi:hypothetical protein
MTIYINTHPNTESGRSTNVYNEGDFKGHLKAPMKDHVEGGKAFTNRCDDMIVIHRLIKHDIMKFVTWVSSRKSKRHRHRRKTYRFKRPCLLRIQLRTWF